MFVVLPVVQLSHVNCVEVDALRELKGSGVAVVAGVVGSVVDGSGTKRRERKKTPHERVSTDKMSVSKQDVSQTGMFTSVVLLLFGWQCKSQGPR